VAKNSVLTASDVGAWPIPHAGAECLSVRCGCPPWRRDHEGAEVKCGARDSGGQLKCGAKSCDLTGTKNLFNRVRYNFLK
jgi:hypothetical protein